MLAIFNALEIIPAILLAALLLKNDHLRKRDTVEAGRIFHITVLTILGAVVNVVTSYIYNGLMDFYEGHLGFYNTLLIAVLCCFSEVLSLQSIIVWNLYVDYGIYKSYDHVNEKAKRTRIPMLLLSVVYLVLYTVSDWYFRVGAGAISVVDAFTYLFLLLQLFWAFNAALIVWKAGKERRPPTFLRLEVFIIPIIIGYVMSLVPVIGVYDYRILAASIAILLTWRTVENRYRYVDPYTGLYNREFLSEMNEFMEQSGYPNGSGIYFQCRGTGDQLIEALKNVKPSDAELFRLGEDEYLMMAGPQKESVIRLLVKSVKLKAAEDPELPEVTSAYAIREPEETAEAFTKRLLTLKGEDPETV